MKSRFYILPAITLALLLAIAVVAQPPDSSSSNSSEARGEASEVNRLPSSKRMSDFSPYVDHDGKISLPKDFRGKWVHLGNWAVAKESGKPVHEMHNVYTPSHRPSGRFL